MSLIKKRIFSYAVLLGVVSTLFVTLPQLLPEIWFIDNLTHFRPAYSYALLISSFVLIFRRCYWFLSVISFVLGACLFFTVHTTFVSPQTEKEVHLRVVSYNLLSQNNKKEEELVFLKKTMSGPGNKIIFLMEVNQAWGKALKSLEVDFPYSYFLIQEDNFGFAIISNIPFKSRSSYDMDSLGFKAIKIVITVGNKDISIWGVHPVPPIEKVAFNARNEYLSNLKRRLSIETNAVIVLGDFNVSPWSKYYGQLLNSTEKPLRRAGEKFPYSSTWAVSVFGTMIDHILYSSELSVVNYEVGPFIGSDHRSLITDFNIH